MASLLVTGAGSGTGRALTERAAKRGDRVIAGVMTEAEADGLRGIGLHVVRMDIGSTDSVRDGFSQADAWLGGDRLDAVVNCAGICPLGALEVQEPEVLLRTLDINAVGAARVLREALPRLRGHGGRIALVSSLWGKVSGPMLSAYCASKFAIEAIADAARRETRGQGVHIVVVEPGVVRTGLVARQVQEAHAAAASLPGAQAGAYGALYAKYAAMIEKNADGGVSAEECAATIDKALARSRPRTRVTVGKDAGAITTLGRLLSDRALDGLFARLIG